MVKRNESPLKLLSKSSRQGGFVLPGVMIALVVASIVSASGWQLWGYYNDRQVAATAAEQHLRVAQAARTALRENYAFFQSNNNCSTNRWNYLINNGYLPSEEFSSGVNLLGQAYQVRYCRSGGSGEPIQTLVLAAGDPATSARVQHRHAMNMGTQAAWQTSAGLMSPFYESFNYELATFGQSAAAVGSVAWFDTLEFSSAGGSEYLYRHAVAGFPELNRMQTDLDMDGNDIANVGDLDAVSVEASQDVNADRDINAGRRLTAAQDLVVGQDALADRDVRAGRNLTVGQDATVARDFRADRDVTAGRNIIADNELRAQGDVRTGGYLRLAYNGHSAGQSCSQGRGAVTIDSSGMILSCQSGRWMTAGGAGELDRSRNIWKDPSSGMKIMWGNAPVRSTVTFPECFTSTSSYSVTLGAGTNFEAIARDRTPCSFYYTTNGNTATSGWIAVGY